MKKLFLFLTILSNSIFAQTPLTLEEMKAVILKNSTTLSQYSQGSVYKSISRGYQETGDGKICEFENIRIDTFLLVPKEGEDENLFEVYFLVERSQKPITIEICGDLIEPGINKVIYLMRPPVPTLQWFANFTFRNKKYFQTDDGLILTESDSEKCYLDFKQPLMFSKIRCENNSGTTDSKTRMPDANLESVYNEIKELPIVKLYPSGQIFYSSLELPKKFGEILQEWKNPLNYLR